MIWHIEAQPTVWHQKPLVFDWDEVAGTVKGDGADYVEAVASNGKCDLHPLPASHTFSDEPLKNREDMAAIIGWEHVVPDWLMPYYPKVKEEKIDPRIAHLVRY
jgi:hypothetical protein